MQAHKFDAIHTNAAEKRRFCRKTNAQLKINMTQINDTVFVKLSFHKMVKHLFNISKVK